MKSALYWSLVISLGAVLGLTGCLADTETTDIDGDGIFEDGMGEAVAAEAVSGSIPADEPPPPLLDGAPTLPDVFGPTDAPAEPAMNTAACTEVLACLEACAMADDGCQSACVARGTDVAQAAYSTLSACMESQGCEDWACVEDACSAELDRCLDGVSEGSTTTADASTDDAEVVPVEGDDTCPEIFLCFEDCDGAEACLDACYAAGSEQGRRGVDGIGACARAHECADSACVVDQCGEAIALCEDGEGSVAAAPAPAGDAGCLEIVQCLQSCGPGDVACTDGCVAQGTVSGRTALGALSTCISAHECDTDACVHAMCGAQAAACEADGRPPVPAGNADALSCVQVYACVAECAGDDEVCRRGCYVGGSAQAQAEVDAVTECLRAHQCHDQECAYAECGAQIAACEAPDEGPGEAGLDAEDGDRETGPRREWNGRRVRAAEPGSCDAPTAVGLGLVQSTTRGARDALQGTCGGQGAERVFVFTTDQDTEVCVDTFGSDFDTVVYVRADACADADRELVCNDDFGGLQSQIGFMAAAGAEYFVVVDSFGDGGAFNLDVTRGPCR